MMGSKTKQKAVSFTPLTHLSSATSTSSTFGIPSTAAFKGKFPAVSSKSVHVQPDLDLVSGFAFLSFASLGELETHIEHNEATSTAISINIGVKRKADSLLASLGPCTPPQKKKTAATVKKKPTSKIGGFTSDGAKPVSQLSKQKGVAGGSLLTDSCGTLQSVRADGAAKGFDIMVPSSVVDSEISLLCSETVDLGEEDETQGEYGMVTSHVGVVNIESAHVKSSSNDLDKIVEGSSATEETNLKPKKKKKKKRKLEGCDQTSQTKFRIKKKKKSSSQPHDKGDLSLESFDLLRNESNSPQVDHEDSDGGKNMSTHAKLSRSKVEKINWCARTAGVQCLNKYRSWKDRKIDTLGIDGQDDQSIELPSRSLPGFTSTKDFTDEVSFDSFSLNSSDQEADIGDETTAFSIYSELSDHSSDLEPLNCQGCFLLNNKIEKVQKEETEKDDNIVDVETVENEVRKNFLVVSGLETGPTGHFSFHPDVTKEGTIDTSIQAYANEIDIFTKCAMMQEGEVIKVISPDDSYGINSLFMQKFNRDPDVVKASRSATERKRRHHIGDLFNDLKLEVFTDLVDADLYFSKQTILSKGIGTIEELEKDFKDNGLIEEKLMKENAELKKKRHSLLFGELSTVVDDKKVEAVLKHLNIKVDDIEGQEDKELEVKKEPKGLQDTDVNAPSDSKAVVEPSVKGRPRAKRTLLSPWQTTGGPKQLFKDDCKIVKATNLETKKPASLEAPSVTHTTTGSSQTAPDLQIPDVSLESQKEKLKESSLKAGHLKVLPLSSSDKNSLKCLPLDASAAQARAKPCLVKIAPKPTVLQITPVQQVLGQVKQPSSDKIICNLSRLSTQQNPSKSSSICIIRSGQLMKSMDSKDVMHIKITSDALKQTDGAGTSSKGSVTTTYPLSDKSKTQAVTMTTSSAKVTASSITSQASLKTRDTAVSKAWNVHQVTGSPRMTFGGQPSKGVPSISCRPITATAEEVSQSNQTSSDAAIRALASLNQLQAKPGPSHGTKPVDHNENPVASILKGLKNVVMRAVGAERSASMPSPPSAIHSLLNTTTVSLKGSTDTQVSACSAPSKDSPENCGQAPNAKFPTVALASSSGETPAATAVRHMPFPANVSTQVNTSSVVLQTATPFNFIPGQFTLPTAPLTPVPPAMSSVNLGVDVDPQVYDPFIEASALITNETQVQEPTTCVGTVLTKDMLPMQATAQNSVFSSSLLELSGSPEISNSVEEWIPASPASHDITTSQHTEGLQVVVPSRSCAGNILTSPLKVEIRDIKKDNSTAAIKGEHTEGETKVLDHTYSRKYKLV